MLVQIARDRAGQLRRPQQARVAMRLAGEPLRWRCPCLGSSVLAHLSWLICLGISLAHLMGLDRPPPPRGWPRPSTFRVGCGLDEVNAFLLQYRLSQPPLDAPENTDARASRRSPRDAYCG